MDKLKPCPFCGSKGVIHRNNALETYVVECTNHSCPASYMIGWDYDTTQEAIESWNRRVNDGRSDQPGSGS